MGNTQVRSNDNRMAFSAMANVLKLTQKDIMKLRGKCLLAAKTGRGDDPETSTVSRSDFGIAMAEVGIIGASQSGGQDDAEVLDRLFTMYDKTGDDRVDHILFLAGISPLSSLDGESDKLLFAFKVFDIKKIGSVSAPETISVLSSINACASYFGDAVLSSNQIQQLVLDVFQKNRIKSRMKYSKTTYIDQIVKHPLAVKFLAGEGTVRFGTD